MRSSWSEIKFFHKVRKVAAKLRETIKAAFTEDSIIFIVVTQRVESRADRRETRRKKEALGHCEF